MIEPEFVDDENAPLMGGDDSLYEDTRETHDDIIRQEANEIELRRRERNVDRLDTEINALERGFNVKIPTEERGRFRLSSGYLQVEKSPGEYVSISKSNGGFLAESTMRSRLGASLARELLGIETPSTSKSRSRLLLRDVNIEMDELPPQRLENIIDDVTKNISTNTDLDMREFAGIDKALTRIKGELANNAGKLTEIDEHIAREQKKLAEIEGSPDLRVHEERVKAKISELQEERAARLEILTQNRKELASQLSRIRQTVEKILDGDLSLREKLGLILREQGITIAAVLASVGLIISTIVTALTGTGGGSATPPKSPNRLGEWVKEKLKALARVLGRLAGKAAAALPGIIGSIIVGILNFLKRVVAAAAGNVWLFLLSIVSLISYKLVLLPSRQAIDSLQEPKKKQH